MPIKLAFAVTETGPLTAAGDYFTARELGTALEERYGWHIEYRSRGSAWYELAGVDVLVAMLDNYDPREVRGAPPHLVTIAWARNWFDRWCDRPGVQQYDLHLASSRKAVDFMSQRIGRRAHLLRIATNTKRFDIGQRLVQPSLDYVFTGSYWKSPRDIVEALPRLPSRFRGAIHGSHWEHLPQLAHLYRGFVPYEQIHRIYETSVMVIDDANHVTKTWGATNSRVFDALAAGCLVITNSQPASDDAFAGRLPVYSSSEELITLLDHYLTHVDERVRLLNELRRILLTQHTYTHRALELGLHLRSLRNEGMDMRAATVYLRRLSVYNTCLIGTSGPGQETVSRWSLEDPSRWPKSAAVLDEVVRSDQTLDQRVVDWPDVLDRQRDLSLVSIVMPIYDQAELTLACLSSLYRHTPLERFELILVDNGSAAPTHQLLVDWVGHHSNARLARQAENLGFALGCNRGFAASRGAVVVFLNNDTELTPNWLPPLVTALEDPGIAVVQPRLLFPDGRVQCLGVVFSRHNPIGYPLYAGLYPAAPWATRDRALQAVTGACLAVRAGDFARLQGFDPLFINGQEDVDLCLRLRFAGAGQAWCMAESTVYHHEGQSQGRRDYITRNRSLFYRRWVGKVRPDDQAHYQADGWRVTAYQPETTQPPRPRHLQAWRPVFDLEG